MCCPVLIQRHQLLIGGVVGDGAHSEVRADKRTGFERVHGLELLQG